MKLRKDQKLEKNKETIVEILGNMIKGNLFYDKKIPEESLILCTSAFLTKTDKKYSKLKTRI